MLLEENQRRKSVQSTSAVSWSKHHQLQQHFFFGEYSCSWLHQKKCSPALTLETTVWRQDKAAILILLSFFPTFCQIANSVSDVHCSASTRFYAKHAGAAAVPIHLRNVGIAKKSEMPQERTEIPRTSLMMESGKETCETPTRCRTFMILKVPLLTICCGSSSASAASHPHIRCLAPRLHCQQSYRQQRPERRSRLSLRVKEKCKWR